MMKLRIHKDLHQRAKQCAENVGDNLSEWIKLCVKNHTAGSLPRVAPCAKSISATRQDSVVITIPGMQADPDMVRCATYSGVVYAEARALPTFHPPAVRGIDYFVEQECEL